MKKLLLSCFMFVVGVSAYSQATCATAVNITANGTFTCPTLTGTYVASCLASTTGIKAMWWKYTPASNGEMTISSNLAANPVATTDTRISVMKGTCAALTCVDSNDDVNEATQDYRSSITVPVAAGTTYYIQWDSRWSTAGFQFSFNFTAASCIRPGAADFYLPDSYTTNSASLYWNNAIGAPSSYDVDWSINNTDAAGTGTIVNVPAGTTTYTQADLSGLPDSLNFRYFVRSNCGATQSAWQGPYYGYLAVPLPYFNDFEDDTKNYTDGFIGFTPIYTSATSTPANYADGGAGTSMYTANSTTAVSNRWAYSRALALSAGEEVTVNFKTRLYATATPANMTMNVTVGADQIASAQTTVIANITASSAAAYEDQTATWTAPADGIYYIGFNNNSPAGAQTFMFFDTLDISSVLSTKSFLASKLNVYPNPSSNIVNVSNDVNAIISTIEMTDLNGRVVKTQNINATNGQVSIADLATGVYMMRIKTDQGSAVKKVVRQ
ncbi:T9SS type A sorting domain-containing protein [Flavobacterium silvisoli]|uniref:T9SS type A sorting domain-containing protein n=1 Tax=Flavobacterium silvisoli TaxID=2529433 RepID=A0A4Q9YX39_9FLAO|nr:T9SS type A sorting domain-containing protein [Flavobacterium silvisoli]TBX68376.1 T9SS type A sorting domain-containing protein [Flavobacterium silvisoli]